MKFENIPLIKLRRSPTNPRKDFDKDRIEEMTESIRAVGLLEPILVVDRGEYFEIVAGETRYRGAALVPLLEMPCVIREMTQKEIVHAQMAENISRSSLNPMEEAEGLRQMLDMEDTDEESVARALGTTRKWVQSRLALNLLPETGREAVRVRAMSVSVAQEILSLDDGEREEACELLLDFGEEITAAQARQTLAERYSLPRARREQWRERWEVALKDKFCEFADPLEDCEEWAKYLRPYGEPYGRWVAGEDVIGGAAVRAEDSALTWHDLGKALGMRGLVVPLHGDVHLIYDRGKIEAIEKAARDAGAPHTLGPRARASEEEEEPPADDVVYDSKEEEDEDMGDYYTHLIMDRVTVMDPQEIVSEIDNLLNKSPEDVAVLLERLGLGDLVKTLIAFRKEVA